MQPSRNWLSYRTLPSNCSSLLLLLLTLLLHQSHVYRRSRIRPSLNFVHRGGWAPRSKHLTRRSLG
ncbi:unnamed protein product [Arabidopsis lyrata]|nr:unnamed protein product [Arabidopsis lyrata]